MWLWYGIASTVVSFLCLKTFTRTKDGIVPVLGTLMWLPNGSFQGSRKAALVMLVWSGWSPGSPALRCHPAVAAALWQQLPCAVVQLHETGLPVFLRTISIAASIDFFSNFCFMKNKVVAIAGLSTWSRRMKMQDVFPH